LEENDVFEDENSFLKHHSISKNKGSAIKVVAIKPEIAGLFKITFTKSKIGLKDKYKIKEDKTKLIIKNN
jgi:hypothetical protein